MVSLLRYELEKICGRKWFFGILIFLQICNLFLLGYSERPNAEDPPLHAYRQLQEDLAEMSNAERLQFMEQYVNDVQSVQLVEQVKLYEAQQDEHSDHLAELLKNQNSQAYARALSLWTSKEAVRYTDNINQEAVFAKQIYAEMKKLAAYPQFLRQIEQRSSTLSELSIFGGEIGDGFSSRNIRKTAADYAVLSDIPITLDLSYGIEAAVASLITDGLVFVFLFLFALMMVYDEKNKGLFDLVKSTPRGQAQTILAKMVVLALCSAVVVLFLYGGSLLFYQRSAGLGDLSRSIQSVGIFMGCTQRLSAGEFLLCFFFIKGLVCFLIGLLVMLISLWIRKRASALLLCTGVLAVSFMLYTWIPFNSRYTILKYMNLFGLFRVQDLLGLYLNLNFFGTPVSLYSAGLGAILISILAFAGLSLYVFTLSDEVRPAYRCKPVSVRRRRKLAESGLVRHELFKILGMNKAAVFLAVYAGLAIFTTVNTSLYLAPDELMYRSYMMQLSGPVTDEKADFIQAERSRFEDLQRKLEQLQLQTAEGDLTEAEAEEQGRLLHRELSKMPAFDRVCEQVERVRQNSGWLVYDTGYLTLLNKDHSGEMLIICLLLISCCYNIFPMEYDHGMDKLIKAAPLGRGCIHRVKRRIALGMTGFVMLYGELPAFLVIASQYGLPMPGAPLASLPSYEHLPAFMSIAVFLVITYTLKLLACLAVTSFVLVISRMIRHPVYTLLVSFLGAALPILLTRMGFAWCGYLGLVPLFHAASFIAQQKSGIVAIYGLAAAAWIAAGFDRSKKERYET